MPGPRDIRISRQSIDIPTPGLTLKRRRSEEVTASQAKRPVPNFVYVFKNYCKTYNYIASLGCVLLTLKERLLTKSFYQKAWLWLADDLASTNHSQAFY